MNLSESNVKVYFTTNLDQFKLIKGNRPVDGKRVSEMAESIGLANWLPAYPIVVDASGNVGDGQHRLAAAKKAGVGVYFIVSVIPILEIARVNGLVARWEMSDYLNFWCTQGMDEYHKLAQFLSEWPQVTANKVIRIKRRDWGGQTADFRNGFFVFHTEELVRRVVAMAHHIAIVRQVDFAFSTYFLVALGQVMSSPLFEEERFKDKLEVVSRFSRRAATYDYEMMLQDVYNHGFSANRVRLIRGK